MYSFIYNALVYCNFLKATSYYCYPIKPDKYCTNLSDLDITQFHLISVCFLIFQFFPYLVTIMVIQKVLEVYFSLAPKCCSLW